MIEKALTGDKRYWSWVTVLLVLMGIGTFFYLQQFSKGLQITGLSRDVPWGFYIAQLTFLVGVAASAVMVVLPYYLHNFKAFGKLAILGEFLAISAVIMCIMFVFVDLGQPFRILNVVFHPSLTSLLFWDTVVLNGYLILNIIISRITFSSERTGVAPPKWIKPLVYLSIPWAISIHTVTAFLYSGLAARPFWLTAILAPRFLASAFACGPALLILICLILRKFSNFDAGKKAIDKLAEIVTYAMVANVFFVLLELFTALYSDMPHHLHHFEYLFLGIGDANNMVPFMWTSEALAVISLVILLIPKLRRNINTLVIACVAVIAGLWIDKGLGLIVTGFIPNPVGKIMEYMPTIPEIFITIGIYALGALILTILYKVAISVREQLQQRST